MIGKANWFRRRKYTGWGFTPVTWQGWVYVFVMILPFIFITNLHKISGGWMWVLVVWAIIFCVDFIDIAIHLPKDERDRMHEAIAERNALWMIIAVLVVGIGYQTAVGIIMKVIQIDPVIIIALFAGTIVKMISNVYLDKKD